MSASADRLVSDYLDSLEAALAGLPRVGRREVLDEIEGHIRESLADLDPGDEVGARNVLDRIGEPSELAAEARDRFGITPAKTTWREIGALIFLSVGGLVLPVVGWFIGVVLLWVSDAWNTREKLLGTLFPPGVAVILLLADAVNQGVVFGRFLLLVGVVFASLLVDGYLLVRLTRRSSLSTT